MSKRPLTILKINGIFYVFLRKVSLTYITLSVVTCSWNVLADWIYNVLFLFWIIFFLVIIWNSFVPACFAVVDIARCDKQQLLFDIFSRKGFFTVTYQCCYALDKMFQFLFYLVFDHVTQIKSSNILEKQSSRPGSYSIDNAFN